MATAVDESKSGEGQINSIANSKIDSIRSKIINFIKTYGELRYYKIPAAFNESFNECLKGHDKQYLTSLDIEFQDVLKENYSGDKTRLIPFDKYSTPPNEISYKFIRELAFIVYLKDNSGQWYYIGKVFVNLPLLDDITWIAHTFASVTSETANNMIKREQSLGIIDNDLEIVNPDIFYGKEMTNNTYANDNQKAAYLRDKLVVSRSGITFDDKRSIQFMENLVYLLENAVTIVKGSLDMDSIHNHMIHLKMTPELTKYKVNDVIVHNDLSHELFKSAKLENTFNGIMRLGFNSIHDIANKVIQFDAYGRMTSKAHDPLVDSMMALIVAIIMPNIITRIKKIKEDNRIKKLRSKLDEFNNELLALKGRREEINTTVELLEARINELNGLLKKKQKEMFRAKTREERQIIKQQHDKLQDEIKNPQELITELKENNRRTNILKENIRTLRSSLPKVPLKATSATFKPKPKFSATSAVFKPKVGQGGAGHKSSKKEYQKWKTKYLALKQKIQKLKSIV